MFQPLRRAGLRTWTSWRMRDDVRFPCGCEPGGCRAGRAAGADRGQVQSVARSGRRAVHVCRDGAVLRARSSSGGAARSLDAGMSNRPTEPYGGFAGGGRLHRRWRERQLGRAGSDPRAQRRRRQSEPRSHNRRATARATLTRPHQTAQIDNPRNWRRVEANGYVYRIDSSRRTSAGDFRYDHLQPHTPRRVSHCAAPGGRPGSSSHRRRRTLHRAALQRADRSVQSFCARREFQPQRVPRTRESMGDEQSAQASASE